MTMACVDEGLALRALIRRFPLDSCSVKESVESFQVHKSRLRSAFEAFLPPKRFTARIA